MPDKCSAAKGPPDARERAQQFGLDQISEVPHETDFKLSFIPQNIEWLMQDKLSAAKGPPDALQMWAQMPTTWELATSKYSK